MLKIDPTNVVPIWKQIEDGVSNLIAAGALRPGEAVASVRELARVLQVNPLTVQKAYRRLVDTGILVVQRGEGTFVSATPPVAAPAERTRKLHEAAERFVTQARSLRIPKNEALALVDQIWPAEPGSSAPDYKEEP